MSIKADYTYYDTVYFDISEFLSEYEKHPCLWDKNHSNFRDRTARSIAEESLGEKLSIGDLNTLRRKIRSVRGTYNAEIRKIKLSLEDGELYVPKLCWFSLADQFLRVTTDLPVGLRIPQEDSENSYAPRKKILQKLPRKKGVTIVMVRAPKEQTEKWENDEMRIESLEEEAFDEELDFIDDGSSLKPDEHDFLSDSTKFDTYEDDTTEFLIERPSNSSPEFRYPVRKKSKRTSQKPEPSLADVVKSLKDIQDASENEFAAFGRSVAVQLQTLPVEIALQLQTDIQAHITRMRLDYLKRKEEVNND